MGHTQSIMSAPTASSPIRALIMLALVVTAHGAGFGRRASFLTTTSGSFTLSGGSSRAGNDESLDLARDLGESLDDAPEHKDEDAAAQHQHTRQMVIMENHFQTVARKATQALAELGESSRTALSPYYKGILQRTLKWGLQKMRARMNTLKGKLKGKSKHNRARCTSPLLPGLVGGMPKKLCEPYQKVCFPKVCSKTTCLGATAGSYFYRLQFGGARGAADFLLRFFIFILRLAFVLLFIFILVSFFTLL